MATTSVSAGKIVDAVMEGRAAIPRDWALDSAGNPTTSASAALQGALLPLGGQVAGYKGSGLAVAVEILCGVLSGGAFGSEVGWLRKRGQRAGISQTFLAIDVGRFMPIREFKLRVARLVEMLKSTLPAPGFEEVLVAGEQEARAEIQRLSSGIPIPRRLWLTLALAHLGISFSVMLFRGSVFPSDY